MYNNISDNAFWLLLWLFILGTLLMFTALMAWGTTRVDLEAIRAGYTQRPVIKRSMDGTWSTQVIWVPPGTPDEASPLEAK